ncbi:sensor histidine kinase [Rhizobium deserti]|uniref:histidine kinase n=1 Tax=Rhizobium deserti TaxID=2547961 RepID=A0A4R5UG65_9HYPH|nr:PAS domain-containing sensor histidine kinase [Rhizobium deserti]TDK34519.1 sensor histidine kinase [Rhizobium deserti]
MKNNLFCFGQGTVLREIDPLYFLKGGGEVGKLIRSFDWTATPLGPVQGWPVALKTTVSTILASRFPAAIVWGPELTTIYNDAFKPILGKKPEAMGQPFSEVWKEAWASVSEIADRAYAGEATFIEDFPLEIDRFGYLEQAYFTFCYSPLHDDQGRIAGLLDTVIETTSKVQAEQQSRLLNSELQHRIKNTLAMVTSIANQTLRHAVSAADAREVLLQRLTALANTHDILTGKSRFDADISDVIAGALSPHDAGQERFVISGPPMRLSERQALSLALAVNELVTNSIKYGALKDAAGHVRISWDLVDGDDGRKFHFGWSETGGPTVSLPSRKGFGSLLIARVVPSDFGGQAVLTFDPSGLRYEIVTDVSRITHSSSAS